MVLQVVDRMRSGQDGQCPKALDQLGASFSSQHHQPVSKVSSSTDAKAKELELKPGV
jgi:hypothetical protein